MRRGEALPLAITEPGSGELMGSVDLRMRPEGRAELGYAVAQWARRRGVGTRAVELVSRYAFEALGVARLEILVQPANAASIALAERAGFVREGLPRSHSVLHGRRYSMVMLSLLPGDIGAAE
jgi:RimJ/RimL family protein N-acetyltransferase